MPVYAANNGISGREAARIGAELCEALSYCHGRKILHRDIKPSNIFISADGDCKLGDFSVSKEFELSEHTLTSIGTPQFMAPELYKGMSGASTFENAVKTDLYSLGLVLYWLMNGCALPFLTGGKLAAYDESRKAFDKRIGGENLPAPVMATGELRKVILKACAYEPDERYQSAEELANALSRSQKESLYKTASRKGHRLWICVLTAVVLALAALGLLLSSGSFDKEERMPHSVATDAALTGEAPVRTGEANPDSTIEKHMERRTVPDSVLMSISEVPLEILPGQEQLCMYIIFGSERLWHPNSGIQRELLQDTFLETEIYEDWIGTTCDVDYTEEQITDYLIRFRFVPDQNTAIQLVLFIPEDGTDVSSCVQRIRDQGVASYAFTSTEKEEIHAEYLCLIEHGFEAGKGAE